MNSIYFCFHYNCQKITLSSEIHVWVIYERISTKCHVPTLTWRHHAGYEVWVSTSDNTGNSSNWYQIAMVIEVSWHVGAPDKIGRLIRGGRWNRNYFRDALSRSFMNGLQWVWCPDTSLMSYHCIQCHIGDERQFHKLPYLSRIVTTINTHYIPRYSIYAVDFSLILAVSGRTTICVRHSSPISCFLHFVFDFLDSGQRTPCPVYPLVKYRWGSLMHERACWGFLQS
jgi:hypothetical protein